MSIVPAYNNQRAEDVMAYIPMGPLIDRLSKDTGETPCLDEIIRVPVGRIGMEDMKVGELIYALARRIEAREMKLVGSKSPSAATRGVYGKRSRRP